MNKVLILLLIVVVFLSCKPNQNGPVPASAGYYGRLYASRFSQYGQHYLGASTHAEFFSPGVDLYSDGDSGRRIFIKDVACNSSMMHEIVGNLYNPGNPGGGTYEGTADDVSTSVKWSVYGANGVGTFDWYDNGPFPDFTGSLPDSVSRSNNVTFNFPAGNVIGADTVAVVMDSRKNASRTKGTTLPGSITFTPADMAAMGGDTAFLNVWMGRYTTQSFGGQRFASIKTVAIYRTVPLRP